MGFPTLEGQGAIVHERLPEVPVEPEYLLTRNTCPRAFLPRGGHP